jgi:hypothetical protein
MGDGSSLARKDLELAEKVTRLTAYGRSLDKVWRDNNNGLPLAFFSEIFLGPIRVIFVNIL